MLRCSTCGHKLDHPTKSGRCVECSIKRMSKAIRQMKNKKGVYYEKYKQGILRYAEKIARTKPKKQEL